MSKCVCVRFWVCSEDQNTHLLARDYISDGPWEFEGLFQG